MPDWWQIATISSMKKGVNNERLRREYHSLSKKPMKGYDIRAEQITKRITECLARR